MIVRVYAPGGCVAVTVNGVPAAAAAAEPSGSELFSTPLPPKWEQPAAAATARARMR